MIHFDLHVLMPLKYIHDLQYLNIIKSTFQMILLSHETLKLQAIYYLQFKVGLLQMGENVLPIK
jgi:hypothetical protein